MNTDRKTAIIVGALFILGFAGVVTAVLTKPILADPNLLVRVSANANQVIAGAFFQFVMAAACAGIGIALYPVLKRYGEGRALGAAGFRIIEAVFQIAGMVILLLLVTLGEESVKGGAPVPSYFQTLGALMLAGNDLVNHVAVSLAWGIGAALYYYAFYQTRLIPRWLAGWGLLGIALTIVASVLVMFRIIMPFSALEAGMNGPIALQELVLAVWLIAKGFNPAEVEPRTGAAARAASAAG